MTRLTLCCLVVISLSAAGRSPAAEGDLLGAVQVLAGDGGQLLVLEALARQVAVVEPSTGRVVRSIPLPARPAAMALAPDGKTLYVAHAAPQGGVWAVELASGAVKNRIAAGHTPSALAVSPDGRTLYVCNRFDNEIAIIDLEQGRETGRVAAVREPVAAALVPDGKLLAVANLLPADRADGSEVAACVTLVDTARKAAAHVRLPNGSTHVRGVCVSPDGKYAYLAHVLARYRMPTTQLERGWMNTNALSIVDLAAGKLLNTVLLDDVDLGAANPWGVACTADGKTLCVSHAGTHELSVIDAAGMLAKLAAMPAERKPGAASGYGAAASLTADDVPNDLAFLVDLRRRIKLSGNGPRGLAVVGDTAYVAMCFSNALEVVDLDLKGSRAVRPLALAPAPKLAPAQRGEMLFNDATLCFQHWQSCASCHPDGRADGLNWDLLNDGLGNPKNNKSMLHALAMAPAMWEGVRPDGRSAVRAGIQHILFAVRPEEEAAAMDEYIKSLEAVPSPRLVNGQLSPAARRGAALFASPRIGCADCHPAPLYTDMKFHDVGSKAAYDRRADFVTPALAEVWRTAPYLHTGQYATIKELLRDGKHGLPQGPAGQLSPQELEDLVEFVLSL